ncbi:MAG TPA: ScyD/ScyE family protein, partial [Chloroflexota bacterium]
GDWYSMTVANNQLVVANPNAGDIDVASPWTTSVTRLVDMSAQPWPGPTTIVYHNGNFYVGMLGEFPTKAGRENIYQVTPSGQVSVYATGLTAVTGIGFDSQNRLYALELSGVSNGPAPFTGQVVRVNASGAPTTIAKGLMFPTAMTFGPDGNIYVSNFGDMGPGAGQVVRVSVPK